MARGTHIDGNKGSSATSFNTAAFTPVVNRLYLFAITIARGSSTQPTAPTVDGSACGLTFIQVTPTGDNTDYDTAGTTRGSTFLFRALVTSGVSNGVIAVTFGYTAQNYVYSVDEEPNVETSGTNGSGAIVQAVCTKGTTSLTPSTTLAAFADATNGTYGFCGGQFTPAGTPQGSGFSLLHSDTNTPTVTIGVITEDRTDNDTGVDAALATSSAWAIIGVELDQTGDATGTPTTLTPTVNVQSQGGGVTETPDVVTPVFNMNMVAGGSDATGTIQTVTPTVTPQTPAANVGGQLTTQTITITPNLVDTPGCAESFDTADARTLGPVLVWTKFTSTDTDGFPGGAGPDDGVIDGNAFSVDGGDRTGLDPAQEGNCWAQAQCEVGSVDGMFAQATIGAYDDADVNDSHYVAFTVGCFLDPDQLALDPYPSTDYYGGPTGIWLSIEPRAELFRDGGPGTVDVNEIWATVYVMDQPAHAYSAISTTNSADPPIANYFSFPGPITPGDVMKLVVDTTSRRWAFFYNGALIRSELFVATLPATRGDRAGLGLWTYWYPDTLTSGAETLDNFQAGDANLIGFDHLVQGQSTRLTTLSSASTPMTGGFATVLEYEYPDLSTPVATLQYEQGTIEWEEQLSESGAGNFIVPNDLSQPTLGNLITFSIDGVQAWTMVVEDAEHVRSHPTGLSEHKTRYGGRGHLSVLSRALTYPVNGLNARPKQHDMVYNWTHPQYDDWWWSGAEWICTVEYASINWPGAPWSFDGEFATGPGHASLPFGDAIIQGAPGDSITTAILGTRFFRKWVYVPTSREYFFFFGGDDTFSLWIDGCPIISTDQDQNFARRNETAVDIDAGWHMFAWTVTNLNRADPSANPCGGAWNLYIPGYPPTLVAYSGDTPGDGQEVVVGPNELGTYVGSGREAEEGDPPGMTVGNALRLWLAAAQGRGDLLDVTLSFDDVFDSNGEVWGPVYPNGIAFGPNLSTKILTDGLTFVREASATYCDVRMRPGTLILDAFNFGTMGTTPGVSFLPAVNTVNLTQHRKFQLANVVVGEYNDKYYAAEDPASIATYGRIEAALEIGAVNHESEAIRVLAKALDTYANPREEISVDVEGEIGYVDYELGDTVSTIDAEENAIDERVTAIKVTQSRENGRLKTGPTVKDLYL